MKFKKLYLHKQTFIHINKLLSWTLKENKLDTAGGERCEDLNDSVWTWLEDVLIDDVVGDDVTELWKVMMGTFEWLHNHWGYFQYVFQDIKWGWEVVMSCVEYLNNFKVYNEELKAKTDNIYVWGMRRLWNVPIQISV